MTELEKAIGEMNNRHSTCSSHDEPKCDAVIARLSAALRLAVRCNRDNLYGFTNKGMAQRSILEDESAILKELKGQP